MISGNVYDQKNLKKQLKLLVKLDNRPERFNYETLELFKTA